MKRNISLWYWKAGILLGTLLCLPAWTIAANYSFTGTFSGDDDVQLFDFTVGVPSTVTLITKSYAGGTLSNGSVIQAGGFDPILSLFDSAGTFIILNDDDFGSNVLTDPISHERFDAFLHLVLGPGTYTASITQFYSFPSGSNLTDGFSNTGDPTFTSSFGCSNGQFCDATGKNRTNEWAFDILNVNDASLSGGPAVPEPTSVLLFGTGAVAVLGWRLMRKTKSS